MQQLEVPTKRRARRAARGASLLAVEQRPTQAAQISSLAAEAHELAMEAVQELRGSGKMTLEQLRSVRAAALKSVERAIAEQAGEWSG